VINRTYYTVNWQVLSYQLSFNMSSIIALWNKKQAGAQRSVLNISRYIEVDRCSTHSQQVCERIESDLDTMRSNRKNKRSEIISQRQLQGTRFCGENTTSTARWFAESFKWPGDTAKTHGVSQSNSKVLNRKRNDLAFVSFVVTWTSGREPRCLGKISVRKCVHTEMRT